MFNLFDVFSLLILGLGVFFGYETGIIGSIFYISSGFVGMLVAQIYAKEPGAQFYFVFLASAGAVILTGFIAGKLLKKVSLGMPDRIVGALLGIILGIAIIGTVVLPVSSHFKPKLQKSVFSSFTGSHMSPWLQKTFPKVQQFSIKDLKELLPGGEKKL